MTNFEELIWAISPRLVPARRIYCVQCICGKEDVIEQEFEKGWHKIHGVWKCFNCTTIYNQLFINDTMSGTVS